MQSAGAITAAERPNRAGARKEREEAERERRKADALSKEADSSGECTAFWKRDK